MFDYNQVYLSIRNVLWSVFVQIVLVHYLFTPYVFLVSDVW